MTSSRAGAQSLNGPRINCLIEMPRAPDLTMSSASLRACTPATGEKSKLERQLMAAVGQGVVIAFQLLGAPWSNLCCSEGQRVEGGVYDR